MANTLNNDPLNTTPINPKDYTATIIGSSVGTLVGIGYAFSKQKHFWGYVGFMLLGSIAFGTVGGIIDFVRKE